MALKMTRVVPKWVAKRRSNGCCFGGRASLSGQTDSRSPSVEPISQIGCDRQRV